VQAPDVPLPPVPVIPDEVHQESGDAVVVWIDVMNLAQLK
jgi:hypothetical protein